MTHARLVAVVLALVLLAAPAAAASEVLIDQAAAIAGGITPGDEPGYPITISRPGKYKLTGPLRVPPDRHGIAITTGDVAIDFNGFTMTGRSRAGRAGHGVLAFDQSRVTVMNGTIVEFAGVGIWTRFGSWAVIENMRVLDNGSLGMEIGNESRVSRSTVSGNGNTGIRCGQGCLIEQSVIARNSEGIVLSAGGMVLGNVIMSNVLSGIIATNGLSGFGNNTLTGNNNGNQQAIGQLTTVHPNACQPTCVTF